MTASRPRPDVRDTGARQLLAGTMTEDELLQCCRDLAKVLGLYVYHARDSRRSEKGWPDLAVIGRRLLLAELKTETGKRTPEQTDVASRLVAAGQLYRLWRPSDWLDGKIRRDLEQLAATTGRTTP